MNFENEKKQALEKIVENDKSRKGFIDEAIMPLVDEINLHPDFYTTSSCAGRIMLFSKGKTQKKHDTKWLLSTHDQITFDEIKSCLEPGKIPLETVWLRMEAPIIHICARDMGSAEVLVKAANESGFRRSCLLSWGKRIIVEINIPEKMDVPICEKGKLKIDDDYMHMLIEHANRKLSESRKKLKKFEKFFSLFERQHNASGLSS